MTRNVRIHQSADRMRPLVVGGCVVGCAVGCAGEDGFGLVPGNGTSVVAMRGAPEGGGGGLREESAAGDRTSVVRALCAATLSVRSFDRSTGLVCALAAGSARSTSARNF